MNHKKNKFDQELDKYYDVSFSREYKNINVPTWKLWFQVTRAKQKMDGAIDELKLKLKSDNGQQSVDLYNREKNMIVGKDSANANCVLSKSGIDLDGSLER